MPTIGEIASLLIVLTGVLMPDSRLAAQTSANAAPLPAQIAAARKLFISNAGVDYPLLAYAKSRAGSSEGFYDQFYAAMKSWGRYQLLPAPASADLILEVKFVESRPLIDPEFRAIVLDPASHLVLWALSETVPAGTGRHPRRFAKSSARRSSVS
jgi:hypothetical protein